MGPFLQETRRVYLSQEIDFVLEHIIVCLLWVIQFLINFEIFKFYIIIRSRATVKITTKHLKKQSLTGAPLFQTHIHGQHCAAEQSLDFIYWVA